jgi:hypothetical protein
VRRVWPGAAPPLRAGTIASDALRQLAIVAFGFVVYFGVRAVTEGDRAEAIANARRVMRFEGALGIGFGPAVQRAALDRHVLVTLANWMYVWRHWPFIAAAAAWLCEAGRRSSRSGTRSSSPARSRS